MDGVEDFIYKYGLHDCRISRVVIGTNKLIFVFDSGVYELNHVGRECCLSHFSEMTLEFEDLVCNAFDDYIDIYTVYRDRVKEISLIEFIKMVEKFKFDVCINFYSNFCNTVLLKGFIGKKKCEISLSQIKSIMFGKGNG